MTLNKLISETINAHLIKHQMLNEYITRDVVYLKDYLSMSDEDKKRSLPHEYHYFFNDFVDEADIDLETEIPDDIRDGDDYELVDWLENNNKDIYNSFADYLYEKVNDHELNIPNSDYPAWSYFDDNPKLVKKQWLIHFTDNADSIVKSGFKYGVSDMTKLGLTTHLGEFAKKYGGYNFAYLLSDFPKYASGRFGYGYKYGKEVVIFNASGIKVWHFGDEEPQVIFYGNTATNIIAITRGENEEWGLHSKSGKLLFENDKLETVVKWFVNNYHQYRKNFYK